MVNELTAKGVRPKHAIILAAGVGKRMVPINKEVPKALLEVNGEPIIEHTINQLKDMGINQITVIIGFLKEQFSYLTDKYGINLVASRILCK